MGKDIESLTSSILVRMFVILTSTDALTNRLLPTANRLPAYRLRPDARPLTDELHTRVIPGHIVVGTPA